MNHYEEFFLKDESIISNNVTVLNALEKNGITTIKDVLDFNEDSNLIRMNVTTKSQVRGIIEMLKYKYGKEDLLVSALLTKPISYDKSGNLNGITFSDLYRMGFTRDDINTLCLYNFGDILENENTIELIDFFRQFIQKIHTKSIVNKMQLYIEYYEERMQKDSTELASKLQQLKSLYTKSKELEVQIKDIESQLSISPNNSSKGKNKQ